MAKYKNPIPSRQEALSTKLALLIAKREVLTNDLKVQFDIDKNRELNIIQNRIECVENRIAGTFCCKTSVNEIKLPV